MNVLQFKRTPCGFCFVEYYTRQDTEAAQAYINGTRLDDRIIRDIPRLSNLSSHILR